MSESEEEKTCENCVDNWRGEECELHGIEIYNDSIACSAYQPKDEE